MIRYAAGSPAATIIVGTEVGILTRMRSVAPGKTFVPASPYLVCPDMKMLTVRKLMMAIEKKEPTITLDPDVAEGARRALERMLAVS
jgi:quinolinate synthase